MSDHPVTVYDAEGSDRTSLRAWRVMLRELWDARELIHRLGSRNVSAQFRQDVLGYLWILLPPVATTLIFSFLRRAEMVKIEFPADGLPPALFMLLGSTLWGFFSQLTVAVTSSVASAGTLVAKIYFPREVLALSATTGAFINLVIRLGLVLLTCALLRYVPHWQALALPLYLAPIALLAIGIGLFLAPVNTMLRDASRALDLVFQFGMLLAPTVYPTPSRDALAGGSMEALYWLHTLNPVAHCMNACTALLHTGHFTGGPAIAVSWAVSLTVFLAGWRFFHVCEPLLAERL